MNFKTGRCPELGALSGVPEFFALEFEGRVVVQSHPLLIARKGCAKFERDDLSHAGSLETVEDGVSRDVLGLGPPQEQNGKSS
jgi:hypothetical protein